MNGQPPAKASSAGWVSLAIALPVAYFLSVEPLALATADSAGMAAPWVDVYAKPYLWLFDHTILEGPIRKYAKFCWWISQ